MPFRFIGVLLAAFLPGIPTCAQSVLACRLEKEGAVLKHNGSGNLSSEITKGESVSVIFANLNSANPTLKIGTVEKQLDLIHADGDVIWVQGFTDEIFGNGIVIWTIDRKSHIVIRTETFRPKESPSQKRSDKLVGISSIGRCE